MISKLTSTAFKGIHDRLYVRLCECGPELFVVCLGFPFPYIEALTLLIRTEDYPACSEW